MASAHREFHDWGQHAGPFAGALQAFAPEHTSCTWGRERAACADAPARLGTPAHGPHRPSELLMTTVAHRAAEPARARRLHRHRFRTVICAELERPTYGAGGVVIEEIAAICRTPAGATNAGLVAPVSLAADEAGRVTGARARRIAVDGEQRELLRAQVAALAIGFAAEPRARLRRGATGGARRRLWTPSWSGRARRG